MLASDGIWGCLSDDEATAIAAEHAEAPQAAADALIAEAEKRGTRDNASAVVVSW